MITILRCFNSTFISPSSPLGSRVYIGFWPNSFPVLETKILLYGSFDCQRIFGNRQITVSSVNGHLNLTFSLVTFLFLKLSTQASLEAKVGFLDMHLHTRVSLDQRQPTSMSFGVRTGVQRGNPELQGRTFWDLNKGPQYCKS